MWYLAACLAGLAAGLWPSTLYMPPSHPPELPLPALRTLAVAQTLFFLIIYPLIMLRRSQSGGMADLGEHGRAAAVRMDLRAAAISRHVPTGWSCVIAESLILLAVATPFYVAAAFVSDAVAIDVLRAVLSVLCILPLAWVAGVYLSWNNAARTLTMLGLLIVAIGLPAGVYLAHEFGTEHLADRLWQLAPATYALANAAPRRPSLLPSPLWVMLLWPAVAAALGLLRMLLGDGARLRPSP